MKSNRILKESAITLRRQGKSYQDIQTKLKIPKSTLNYWLSSIPLSKPHKQKLHNNWKNALKLARKKASLAHQKAKQKRIKVINNEAENFIQSINLDNKNLELFLAGLYLGDGFKIEGRMALGSSNPQILIAFVKLLRKLYHVKESRLRAAIFARSDQSSIKLINYWSKILSIPKNQFHKTQLDKRTRNSKTRLDYNGVCSVVYCDTKLQRRILAISNEVLEYIIN
jgi:hypothetical protein